MVVRAECCWFSARLSPPAGGTTCGRSCPRCSLVSETCEFEQNFSRSQSDSRGPPETLPLLVTSPYLSLGVRSPRRCKDGHFKNCNSTCWGLRLRCRVRWKFPRGRGAGETPARTPSRPRPPLPARQHRDVLRRQEGGLPHGGTTRSPRHASSAVRWRACVSPETGVGQEPDLLLRAV